MQVNQHSSRAAFTHGLTNVLQLHGADAKTAGKAATELVETINTDSNYRAISDDEGRAIWGQNRSDVKAVLGRHQIRVSPESLVADLNDHGTYVPIALNARFVGLIAKDTVMGIAQFAAVLGALALLVVLPKPSGD